MPAPKLDQLSSEVMELTPQPGLAVIRQRSRRRRFRRRLTLAAAFVVTLQLAGGLLWSMWPAVRHGNTISPPTPVPSGLVPFPDGPVHWAAAGDRAHLYALLDPCGACQATLVGTDDGGQTWTVRITPWSGTGVGPEIRGPRTLVRPAITSYKGVLRQSAPTTEPAMVSTDGGRTWVPLRADASPLTKVPAGGWLDCGDDDRSAVTTIDAGQPCALRAVDPAHQSVRPLATPPGITPNGTPQLPAAAGLWVVGADAQGRPSVSVSRDRGTTWSTHTFTTAAGHSLAADARILVTTHDGTTVDALIGAGSDMFGFRSTDGGLTWSAADKGATLPTGLSFSMPGLTLPDGTRVVQRDGVTAEQAHALFERPGAMTYTTSGPRQWPALLVRPVVDGSYLAHDGTTLYTSADGTSWTRTTPPG